MNNDPDEIMDLKEVATLLRVTTETVRLRAIRGELPGRRIGRRGPWRFIRSEVLASLQPDRKPVSERRDGTDRRRGPDRRTA